MAGHSHFKNIKRKKEAEDKKRAKTFSKLSRLIIGTVREKGKDPQANPDLRTLIEKAKETDMPLKNIEKAIERGAGEGEQGKLTPFIFEAYGPEELALIIEGQTDNRNRDLDKIKEVLKRHEGKLAKPGSVTWLFEKKGIIEIEIKNKNISEEEILQIIEEGAEDIKEKEGSILAYTNPNNIKEMKKSLEKRGFTINSANPGWKPRAPIKTKKNYKELVDDLLEMESIEEVYTNA